MGKATLKGLLAHKFRLAATALAIVLGVSFVAGTFVLTDTIKASFEDLFADVYNGVDAVRPLQETGGFDTGEVGDHARQRAASLATDPGGRRGPGGRGAVTGLHPAHRQGRQADGDPQGARRPSACT